MSIGEYLGNVLNKNMEDKKIKEMKNKLEGAGEEQVYELAKSLEKIDDATRVLNEDLEDMVGAVKAYRELPEEEKEILDEYGITGELEEKIKGKGLSLDEPVEKQVRYESEDEFYERKEGEIDDWYGLEGYEGSIIGDVIKERAEEKKDNLSKEDYLEERELVVKDQ